MIDPAGLYYLEFIQKACFSQEALHKAHAWL